MPNLYIIGGANGAGKTTVARELLPHYVRCYEFVNADAIAAGLSPFRPETVAMQAGRLMLQRMHSLADESRDFCFESTLASRSFLPFVRSCVNRGYTVDLLYLWLPKVELAVQRVAQRVAAGGHNISRATIERRYEASRRNLIKLYIPLCETWHVFENSGETSELVAHGGKYAAPTILSPVHWAVINREDGA